MKNHCHVFISVLFFICISVLINLASGAKGNSIYNDIENICKIETKNYAIYPSDIIEDNPSYINKYVHYSKNINVQFPQIYFSNDYSAYDIDIETKINKHLFLLSLGYDVSFLIGRDSREIREYRSYYTITKSDVDIFSIKYYGHLYTISHAKEFCYGITVNVQTGEIAELSDFVSINNNLIEGIERGEIKYYSNPMYDKTFVIEAVSNFIESYSNFHNKNTLFFVSENTTSLIVPVSFGNANYIILEIY